MCGCVSVRMYKCANVWTYKSTSVQSYKCTDVLVYKCMDAQTCICTLVYKGTGGTKVLMYQGTDRRYQQV